MAFVRELEKELVHNDIDRNTAGMRGNARASSENQRSEEVGSGSWLDGYEHIVDRIGATSCGKDAEKVCVVCKHDGVLRASGVAKTSMYWCTKCKVGLCPAKCFARYHSDKIVCPNK